MSACYCIGPPGDCPCMRKCQWPPMGEIRKLVVDLPVVPIGLWQKCPSCDGSGVDANVRIANTATPPCPTCNGKRIISTLTGHPPTT